MKPILNIAILILLLGTAAHAQVGPVGPKSEPVINPPASSPKPTAPVDLPYKPKAEPAHRAPVKKEPLPEEEAVKEPPKEIPFIPSKSPESFGAHDPAF